MDKWQKLKGFLTDGKEHITKDFYVSRPSVFEEILDIMEELEKREQMSDIEKAKEHIKNLANDYKCYDNTISFEEALALNEALQNPCKACDYFADDNISYCRKSEVEGD